jgi:hypothetical protein
MNVALLRSLGREVPLVVEKKPLRTNDPDPAQLRRSYRLDGLLHEYQLAAWAGRMGFSAPTGTKSGVA